jgi:hypothetical protein
MPLRTLRWLGGDDQLAITRRARTRALSSDSVLVRRVVVGLRGFRLNPALLVHMAKDRQLVRNRRPARRRERRVTKRLRLTSVGSRVRGRGNCRRARTTVWRRQEQRASAGAACRSAGASFAVNATETARLVQLYGAGLPQKDIAQRLGRSPSAVWHCLRRLGRA